MEGSRLILKRKVRKGSERLLLALGGGVGIALVAMILQLKTTLSQSTLSAVRDDVRNMREQFGEGAAANSATAEPEVAGETDEADEASESIDELKTILEAAVKAHEETQVVAE